MWDGTSWVDFGSLTLPAIYGWVETDVSATLNTWDKINGCRVRITSVIGAAFNVNARRLTRKVDYTIPPVTVTIVQPQNITYDVSTIPVEITASGGTVDKIWFNCWNGSAWVYAVDQTYTIPTSMLDFVNGDYTFYAWASNLEGSEDEKTVTFTVELPQIGYAKRKKPSVSTLQHFVAYLTEKQRFKQAIEGVNVE